VKLSIVPLNEMVKNIFEFWSASGELSAC